jgi:hypothetical protein
MVEYVEEFRAEFETLMFAEQKLFDQRGVPFFVPNAKEAQLPFEGQRAPVHGVPLLAHETGKRGAIAKCLGATFLSS